MLRRSRPKVGVRWHFTNNDLGIAVYNDGGRTVTVTVGLNGLDPLREAGAGRILLSKDLLKRTLRPGEETPITITSPYLAEWVNSGSPATLDVSLTYKRWPWKKARPRTTHLEWSDLFNEMFPNKSDTEQIADKLEKIERCLRREMPAIHRTLRRIERSFCKHEYDPEGRLGGEFCERCKFVRGEEE